MVEIHWDVLVIQERDWGDEVLWHSTPFFHHMLDIDSKEIEVEKEH